MESSSFTECWVGLVLTSPAAAMLRHQSQVHEQGMLAADLYRHLTNRFKERQGFDIAYGTADFHQHDVMAFAARQYALFDSVGDVRDNLNGRAQVVATALFCAARRSRYGRW
ncbi:Uncharacterised protein [Klebsiella pneumoniae subsp. rhinoscleromatis]|nr:Uncharacterised protein [Klebsiella pneumoniae subsp. rhinoscleromatis]